jgi:hypothetical protein
VLGSISGSVSRPKPDEQRAPFTAHLTWPTKDGRRSLTVTPLKPETGKGYVIQMQRASKNHFLCCGAVYVMMQCDIKQYISNMKLYVY